MGTTAGDVGRAIMPDRYEQEIEEILKEAGETPPPRPTRPRGGPGPSFWRLLWLYAKRSIGGRTWPIRPGRLMLIGVSLLILALVFGRVIPGLGGPLAIGGLLLFGLAYVMFFVKPSSSIEKRWRGRRLEDNTAWWERFYKRQR